MTKRFIEIEGIGKTLELTKATSVKTTKEFIQFDKLNDGTWRMIWSDGLIPDMTKVEAFRIVRED